MDSQHQEISISNTIHFSLIQLILQKLRVDLPVNWPERARRTRTGDKKPEDILATALFLVVQISLMMDPYIHLEHTDGVAGGFVTSNTFLFLYFSNLLLEMIVYVSHSDPGNCIFFLKSFSEEFRVGSRYKFSETDLNDV